MKVYVVIDGSAGYSEPSAVFETKEAADRFVLAEAARSNEKHGPFQTQLSYEMSSANPANYSVDEFEVRAE